MLLQAWFRAFTLTCLIEVPIVACGTRSSGHALRRRLLVAFCAQLLTHPFVWSVFPSLPGVDAEVAFTLSELYAWLGECAFYVLLLRGVAPARAAGLSGVANALSLAAGLLLG
jgi:hypothetical protein